MLELLKDSWLTRRHWAQQKVLEAIMDSFVFQAFLGDFQNIRWIFKDSFAYYELLVCLSESM